MWPTCACTLTCIHMFMYTIHEDMYACKCTRTCNVHRGGDLASLPGRYENGGGKPAWGGAATWPVWPVCQAWILNSGSTVSFELLFHYVVCTPTWLVRQTTGNTRRYSTILDGY